MYSPGTFLSYLGPIMLSDPFIYITSQRKVKKRMALKGE